jgi:hypothetical protein
MSRLFSICLLFFSFLCTTMLFSQNEPNGSDDGDKEDPWENITGCHWIREASPIVEVSYGYGKPYQTKFDGEFARFGSLDFRLGYSRIKMYDRYVVEMDEHFAFGSWFSKDLNLNDDSDSEKKVQVKLTRFGFGSRMGYGYEFSKTRILPYSQMQVSLTELKSERPPDLNRNDMSILNRYEGSYRFSDAAEGGIRFEFFRSVAVSGSYEVAVVYPRVVFFPWLGGLIIQNIMIEAVSHFAEDIVDRSPTAGPIMYALIRNGMAYVVYLGKKERMNWPFSSETPLTHESFKLGLTFSF